MPFSSRHRLDERALGRPCRGSETDVHLKQRRKARVLQQDDAMTDGPSGFRDVSQVKPPSV
jgi:hypothetical protein